VTLGLPGSLGRSQVTGPERDGRRASRHRWVRAGVAALLVAVAACGSSDDDASGPQPEDTPTAGADPAPRPGPVEPAPESDRSAHLAPDAQGPWAPPHLVDPETVEISAEHTHARLERGRDYVVELTEPIEEIGGVIISGGRNVVLVGGHITIPWAGEDASAADRRGLFLRWQTGTVHVEGLLIDNSGGDLSEGIQINAPRARVQLVNVRIDGVHARDPEGFTDNHPDLVQPWGGAGELRIWGFTGASAYQGIFLKADQHELGRVILDRVNLRGLAGARYLLWAAPGVSPEVGDVWVRPAPGRSILRTLRPELPDDTWTRVHQGDPPGGDFVPAEMVGHGYDRLAVDEERDAA
jgi:hypothetical protein